MAKAAYIGVGGVARKINSSLIGANVILGTLTNILKDGSFENGTSSIPTYDSSYTSIASSTAKVKYGSKALAVTIKAVSSSNQQVMCTIDTVVGHVYYMIGYFNVEGTTVQPKTTFSPPDGWNWLCATNGVSGGSGWQRLSSYYKNTEYTSMKVRFAYYGGSVGDTFYLDGATIIDLTEAFGTGKEPSKEWLDSNVDFFASTIQKSISVSSGIARRVTNGYIGVAGVARKFFGYSHSFWKMKGDLTIYDYFSGVKSGKWFFNIKSYRASNTYNFGYAGVTINGDFGGKKLVLNYSHEYSRTPGTYGNAYITFYASGQSGDSYTYQYKFSETSGATWTYTIPSGIINIDIAIRLGEKGDNDMSLSVNSLSIGSEVLV